MKMITRNELVNVIKATEGRIFRVTFIKKTSGEIRDMTARFGVTSELKGGKLPFNADEKKLLIVYDMEKNDYRAISIEGLISGHIDNIEYITEEAAKIIVNHKKA